MCGRIVLDSAKSALIGPGDYAGGLPDNKADGAEGTIPYKYLDFVDFFNGGVVVLGCLVLRNVWFLYSFEETNKVDTRLHEFGVLKEIT